MEFILSDMVLIYFDHVRKIITEIFSRSLRSSPEPSLPPLLWPPSAFQPIPHMGVYAATKSFLLSIMTAIAIELKDKNVAVTTSCPSGMATTDAMKESIKSMGLNGKLTTLSAIKVAKISLKALKKKKIIVVPGAFNKFVEAVSRPFTQTFLAKTTGKMWKKSQAKRHF